MFKGRFSDSIELFVTALICSGLCLSSLRVRLNVERTYHVPNQDVEIVPMLHISTFS
jgi:hypothetical protein